MSSSVWKMLINIRLQKILEHNFLYMLIVCVHLYYKIEIGIRN